MRFAELHGGVSAWENVQGRLESYSIHMALWFRDSRLDIFCRFPFCSSCLSKKVKPRSKTLVHSAFLSWGKAATSSCWALSHGVAFGQLLLGLLPEDLVSGWETSANKKTCMILANGPESDLEYLWESQSHRLVSSFEPPRLICGRLPLLAFYWIITAKVDPVPTDLICG